MASERDIQIGYVIKEVGKPPRSYIGIENVAKATGPELIENIGMVLDPTNVLGQEPIAPTDAIAAKSNEAPDAE